MFPTEEARLYKRWIERTKKRGVKDLRHDFRIAIGSDPPDGMGKGDIIKELTLRKFPNVARFL